MVYQQGFRAHERVGEEWRRLIARSHVETFNVKVMPITVMKTVTAPMRLALRARRETRPDEPARDFCPAIDPSAAFDDDVMDVRVPRVDACTVFVGLV